MLEKLISSVKSLSNSHMGMMFLCCLLMLGAFWGLSGSQSGSGGLGAFGLLIPLIVCLGMHFVMHRFSGHGGHKKDQAESCQTHREDGRRIPKVSKPKRYDRSSPRASI